MPENSNYPCPPVQIGGGLRHRAALCATLESSQRRGTADFVDHDDIVQSNDARSQTLSVTDKKM